MTKIAAIADVHLGSKRPALFLGSDRDWHQLMFETYLKDAVDTAVACKAVDFIIAGDLFHTPNVSWHAFDVFYRRFNTTPLDVTVIPGMGHDAKLSDLSDSPLDLINVIGEVAEANSTVTVLGCTSERWTTRMVGSPDEPDKQLKMVCPPFMMREEFLRFWQSDPDLPDGDIMVVHGPIIHDGPPQLPHIEPSTLTVPYKLVICGDIHTPWHYEDLIRGTMWASPGSIIANTRSEAAFRPELMIATFTKDKELALTEFIPLGEPRDQLFGSPKTEVQENSIISSLSEALASAGEDNTPSYVALVHDVARQAELTQEQLTYLNDKLEGTETEVPE